ncbi:MAG: circularly permuted type 2 ATP-grasp protein [Pseudomonadota bacterium]
MKEQWEDYPVSPGIFDELVTLKGRPRASARKLIARLRKFSQEEINARVAAADLSIREMGISFTVYSQAGNIDRAWPFDIIPRVIGAQEWERVSDGLNQRMRALNMFIHDVYNKQDILDAGIVPRKLVLTSAGFKEQCVGMKPPFSTWAHVCGTDLVRDQDGSFYVLEDNLRIPSGVSYMVENRQITKRVLPEIFRDYSILPVDDYPSMLYRTLASIAPGRSRRPCVVVLTPGIYNSAYFEHAFLAQGMGAELVEGIDLFVSDDDEVFMRTVDGPRKVDVIYRRVDEDFIDPEVFRKDSVLGVPGLMRAWRAGNVAIANAPGSGVADNKAIYAYVPDMIRFYLNEEPQINNVTTYLCSDPEQRDYVLNHLPDLVVKPTDESGGYGIMVGPQVSSTKHREYARLIRKRPEKYIAQPTLSLSTAPTLCEGQLAPRHLDLRPFLLQGKDNWVTPGGLTRVALKEGSLVVNSSQGGGSKDTWIVE